ncbi:protein IQ-DOMAIN 9-like [Impatiens glandulifera]|uniref:protein IQ-DOMAIN 9-like n=1 Tax=Impatiens glandulifera TaxID=253017 RepID=UPI001FB07C02|nr:protein IQ-DOMAIN 9-like [Impatiens glandulifera]
MGSGDWIRNIIRFKKVKSKSKNNNNGFKCHNQSSCTLVKDSGDDHLPAESMAVVKIQTAIRAYLARRNLRRLRGMVRLKNLAQCESVKKQAVNTLSHLHTWSRIQSQIRTRRFDMVTEGRIRQKKLENQLKLEAKLHHLEVEWSGGCDSMEETVSRIHQREEAAVKRERAMAYAFSHQWRANSTLNLGPNAVELGKANWGWSWVERWITARPWENRLHFQSSNSPKKLHNFTNNNNRASPKANKKVMAAKSISPSNSGGGGKGKIKGRKLSYSETTDVQGAKEQKNEEDANGNNQKD